MTLQELEKIAFARVYEGHSNPGDIEHNITDDEIRGLTEIVR